MALEETACYLECIKWRGSRAAHAGHFILRKGKVSVGSQAGMGKEMGSARHGKGFLSQPKSFHLKGHFIKMATQLPGPSLLS